MTILMTFMVALKALRRNALRTSLTALGMIIGVAAVIIMVAIGTGARTSIEAQIRNAGSNIVSSGCPKPMSGVTIDWWAPPSGASVRPDGVATSMKRASWYDA